MSCPVCRGGNMQRTPSEVSGRSSGVDVLYLPAANDRLVPPCAVLAGPTPGPLIRRPGPGLLGNAEVAWFRWIVGHQLLFMQWRLVGEALRSKLGAGPQDFGMGPVASLIDICSVLILYCGSCTSGTYLAVLRPVMSAHHPAFSGQWADDYRALSELARAVTATGGPLAAPSVDAAWQLYQRVHGAVARRLVPGQPSLLQQSGRAPGAAPSAAEARLYDSFFRTHRTTLCRRGFAVQLAYWLALVMADLDRRGLYYDDSPLSGGMTGAHGDRVARLEVSATSVLARQAALVADRLRGGDE
jgi:L-tyrosine peroxygenase